VARHTEAFFGGGSDHKLDILNLSNLPITGFIHKILKLIFHILCREPTKGQRHHRCIGLRMLHFFLRDITAKEASLVSPKTSLEGIGSPVEERTHGR
jgi:hypothetical protein